MVQWLRRSPQQAGGLDPPDRTLRWMDAAAQAEYDPVRQVLGSCFDKDGSCLGRVQYPVSPWSS
jgi:hypothetical protein